MDTAQRSAGPPDEGGEVRARWFGPGDGYLLVASVVAPVRV
ncbi:hypothetical protein ACPESR_22225 [Nocardia testacea]